MTKTYYMTKISIEYIYMLCIDKSQVLYICSLYAICKCTIMLVVTKYVLGYRNEKRLFVM